MVFEIPSDTSDTPVQTVVRSPESVILASDPGGLTPSDTSDTPPEVGQ
jgi:hypothetical protein